MSCHLCNNLIKLKFLLIKKGEGKKKKINLAHSCLPSNKIKNKVLIFGIKHFKIKQKYDFLAIRVQELGKSEWNFRDYNELFTTIRFLRNPNTRINRSIIHKQRTTSLISLFVSTIATLKTRSFQLEKLLYFLIYLCTYQWRLGTFQPGNAVQKKYTSFFEILF